MITTYPDWYRTRNERNPLRRPGTEKKEIQREIIILNHSSTEDLRTILPFKPLILRLKHKVLRVWFGYRLNQSVFRSSNQAINFLVNQSINQSIFSKLKELPKKGIMNN